MLAYFLKQDVSTIDLDGPVPPFPPVEQVKRHEEPLTTH